MTVASQFSRTTLTAELFWGPHRRLPRDEAGEWKALQRRWCFGEEQFPMELLEQMGERLGTHHGGSERIESAEAKDQRIVGEEMARRGGSEHELEQRRKADTEKIKIARRLGAETSMTSGRTAERLAIGTSGYTADCLRKTLRDMRICGTRFDPFLTRFRPFALFAFHLKGYGLSWG